MEAKDYEVKVNVYTYLLNVCGKLNSGTDACADEAVGACQTKPTDSTYQAVKTGKFFVFVFRQT